jgi:hypothetical protein
MSFNPLNGIWRLQSFKITDQEDRTRDVLGPNPVGYLIYTEDGYMSTQMMSSNRPSLSQDNLRTISMEEKARAAETYRAYSGRYTIEGNKVIHHVEVGLIPNWINHDLVRFFELQDDILTILVPNRIVDGKQHSVRLVWKRTVLAT